MALADPAPSPPPPPAPPPRDVADFVINFKGAQNEAILDASHALYDRLVPPNYKSRIKFVGKYPPALAKEIMVDQNTNRHLIRLARSTNTISSASEDLFSRLSHYMLVQMGLLHLKLGRIFIHGSSSGGRNAIDFAAHLSRLGLVPHFVGVVDGAFFQDDTQSRPEDIGPHERTSTIPVFNVNVGAAPKARCHNWFQTLGNHVGTIFALDQKIFTSAMNGEIHGKMLGFATNRNVDADVPHPNTISDSDAHSECCRIGNDEVHSLIGFELKLLSAK